MLIIHIRIQAQARLRERAYHMAWQRSGTKFDKNGLYHCVCLRLLASVTDRQKEQLAVTWKNGFGQITQVDISST